MLYHMSSTEYLNYEAGKFSKSRGVGVFGTDAEESGIAADVWRFYIFYNRPEKSDAIFTWKDFEEKVNGELIGNLGNLVNRTLAFVERYYDGKVPAPKDDAFWTQVRDYEKRITEKLECAEERDAFHLLFELTSAANKRFQDGQPWKTRTEKPEEAAALIGTLAFLVKDLAILMYPYLPAAAEKLAGFFGLNIAGNGKNGLSWADLGKLEGLSTVADSAPLFTKLDDKFVTELRGRYSGSQAEREEEKGNRVKVKGKGEEVKGKEGKVPPAFESTLDLRTAKIVKVERVPNADKLFKETLDIAGETRVICSGLVGFYTEEDLLGKSIIVAYNLKPRMMRGVESHGMLIAGSAHDADGKEIVDVLDSSGVPSGTRVTIENADPAAVPPAEITVNQFDKVPLTVEDHFVKAGGRTLLLDGKPIRAEKVANGTAH
jgi:methionyl-tRNA synthetase